MFKKLIKEKELTQKYIAFKFKITQSLVSQWCSGKCEPSIRQLKPLCEILNIDLKTLVECFE